MVSQAADLPTTRVDLTDQELVLLDGKCRPAVQVEVEQAKTRQTLQLPGLNAQQARFVADVVAAATKHHRLGYQGVALSLCQVCGVSAGYRLFKSGPRRGRENLSKPLTLYGIDLEPHGPITFSVAGYASLGCCNECFGRLKPALLETLAPLRAELPKSLTGVEPGWRLVPIMRCTGCNWEGPGTEMKQLRNWLGTGHYPGGCPSCPARNEPFTAARIKDTGAQALIETATGTVHALPAPEKV